MLLSSFKFLLRSTIIFCLSFLFFVFIFENNTLDNHQPTKLPVTDYFLNHLYNKKTTPKTQSVNDKNTLSFTQNSIKARTPMQDQETEVFLPILLYHYVDLDLDQNDKLRMSLTVPPKIFEQQMKALVNAGYTTVTLYDLSKDLLGETTLPSKRFILTFDDGYEDFYTNVFPILKRYNLKATNFLILNTVNLKQNLKTWQIYELYYSNLVDFGAHSVSHSNLPTLSADKMEREIVDSKYNLKDIANISIDFFSYPGGRYNNRAIELVKSTPYKAAVSTDYGLMHTPLSQFRLTRIKPGRMAPEALLKIISRDQDLYQGSSTPHQSHQDQ